MAEGRRYGPDNPSPANQAFAQYIRDKGEDITDRQVALTNVYHREWQIGHAEETRQERASGAEEREAEKARKAQERQDKKEAREIAKKDREDAAEVRRQEREAKKAAKAEEEAAKQLDGDDSDVVSENGEPAKTSRRVRLRGGEQEAVAVSEPSF